MVSALFFFLIGLLVGWFFLPVPVWVTAAFMVVLDKFPALRRYIKK